MKTRFAKLFVLLAVIAAMVAVMALPAMAAKTVTVLDGKVSVTDSVGTGSVSGGTVTITATGGFVSKQTNTVTITNTSGSKAKISFVFAVTGDYNSFTTPNGSASGSYSGVLEADASMEIKIEAKARKTAKLTLNSFSIETVSESADVTVNFDSSMGSVTADGTAVSNGTVLEGVTSSGTALVATPKSGVTFLGWIDGSNQLLSTSASFTLIPTANMTVQPVFTTSATAWFLCPNGAKNYMYNDLNTAVDFAGTTGNKTVILANNATLPAGNYEIDAGVTLLVPCDSANTLYTTAPGCAEGSYTTPVLYRTLTLASGANITVKGGISVAGIQSSKYAYNGCVSNGYGKIVMNAGSSISVENGGNLYAWGYITGSGGVEIKSGGTVYECFQLTDFRGGQGTTKMKDNSERVFPMSQYFLQNVEVPMKIYAGAYEYAFISISITAVGLQDSDLPVVSPPNKGAMFQISSGYIIKDYIEGTGRISFQSHGDVSISSIALSMNMGIGYGDVSIDSANYYLPIPGHFNVDAVSGNISINQDLALLPGSELYIRKNATATLAAGVDVVAYSWSDWGGYCGAENIKYEALPFVAGGNGTTGREKDALIQVDGTIDATLGTVCVTSGGANIYSTGTGVILAPATTAGKTYQATQIGTKNILGGTDYDIEYTEIATKSPILKDGCGTSIQAVAADTYVYCADTQMWCPQTTHRYGDADAEVIAPDCENGGYTAHTCIACGDVKKTDATDALGHTEVTDAAVAATCTSTGLTEGKHCSVCGKVTVAQEVLETLDHTAETDAAKEATCTDTGLTEGKHCSACGEVLIAQTVVPALGHTVVVDKAVAATCTATGLTEGSHCSVCNTVLVAQNEVPKADHTEVVDAAVAATCTSTGLTEGKHCSVCNEVLVAQTEIPMAKHSYNGVVTAPNCTNGGYTTYTCSVCGDSYVGDQTAALSHTVVVDEAVAATCTSTGLTEGSHCSVCNTVLVAQTEVPMADHAFVDGVCGACGAADPDYVPPVAEPTVALEFQTASLTLANSLAINFKAYKEIADEYTDLYAIFTMNGKTVRVDEYYVSGKYIVFDFPGIAANHMNSVVSAVLYGKAKCNGQDYVSTKNVQYGVYRYCQNMLGKYWQDPAEAKFCTAMVDLLNYGAAAQLYNNYKTDNLANNWLNEGQKALATQNTPAMESVQGYEVEIENPKVTFSGASLVLDSAVVQRIRVNINVGDVSDYTYVVRTENGKTWTYTAEDLVETDATDAGVKRYYIYMGELFSTQMSTKVFYTVYEGDTIVSHTFRYSTETFAYKYQDSTNPPHTGELLVAMIKYGNAVKAYAG